MQKYNVSMHLRVQVTIPERRFIFAKQALAVGSDEAKANLQDQDQAWPASI